MSELSFIEMFIIGVAHVCVWETGKWLGGRLNK